MAGVETNNGALIGKRTMMRSVAALLAFTGMSVRVAWAVQPINAECCSAVSSWRGPAPMAECCLPAPEIVGCCEPAVVDPCCPTPDAHAAPPEPASAVPTPAQPERPAQEPTPAPPTSSAAKPISPPPLAVPSIPSASPTPPSTQATETPAAAPAGRYSDDPLADPLRAGATPGAPAPSPEQPIERTVIEESLGAATAEPEPQPDATAPASPAAGAPTTETEESSIDDLFSEPSAASPSSDPAATPANETPSAPAAEPAPTTPPEEAEKPASDEEVDVNDLFGEPAASEPPAAEAPPTDEGAPADQPSSETPPGEESAPPEESKPTEEPLDFDSLFGPSSSNDVLSEPGGWRSTVSRAWHYTDGEPLAAARIGGISHAGVTLLTDKGQTLDIEFRELSNADLAFLRKQLDARQAFVAEQQRAESRLAEKSR
jgi:hypothetical protein